MPGYSIILDPQTHQPIPENGILTRPVFEDESIRVVMFTFSAGQRLSEHTASTPAMLQFLGGDATVTLGPDQVNIGPGAWIRMDAGLAHSIVARTPLTMLLALIKAPAPRKN